MFRVLAKIKNTIIIMSHIWDQTIKIDEKLAKQLIEGQNLIHVLSISVLGEGYDNIAYLVNNNFVFRFPRRDMGIDCIENEILILPYIASKVSFPLSCPTFIGKPTSNYPAPFAGYKMLVGQSLSETTANLIDDKNFAQTLAQWLKELHLIPILKEHVSCIKGDQSWRTDVQKRIEICKERIIKYSVHYENSGFNKDELFRILDLFANFEISQNYVHFYIHGDLYPRHILVNKFLQPVGLIDWGDIHIGHREMDLAIAYAILSDDALLEFKNIYGEIDPETEKLSLFRVLYHSIALIPYCYEKKQTSLLAWSELSLKNAIERVTS